MTAPGIFAAPTVTAARRSRHNARRNFFSVAPLTPLDLCYIPRIIWNSQSEVIP